MATFKVLLDQRRPLKDGTYPLVVRIFNERKFKDISLKTYLHENQFDPIKQKVNSNHLNKKVINQAIAKTLLRVQQTTLNLQIQDEIVSVEKIRNAVVRPKLKMDFFSYGEMVINEMEKVNRYGNANYYRVALNAFKAYSGKSELQFKEINFDLLNALDCEMFSIGLKKNTIAAYHRAIRSIFNRAINADLVEVKFYPYRKYKIKGEKTAKRNISKESIAAISKMELKEGSQQWHARNYFMLSFYLRGISFADMASMRPSDIINGRLTYKRKKTHKHYTIKLTGMAIEILSYYQKPNRTYILPVLGEDIVNNPDRQRKTIIQAIKVCNKYLKDIGETLEIQKLLTTYVARYSWANIAKSLGYSKDLIAEALGHEFGNAVTGIYLDTFDQDVIDEMNERVCSF